MTARPTEGNLTPIFLGDMDLWAMVDGSPDASSNWKQALTGVVLTPTAATTTLQTMSPKGSFSSVGTPTWAMTLNYAQDWETETSLSNWLYDQDGKAGILYFSPKSGKGKAWKCPTPRIIPGGVGGTGVNAAAVGAVTLGITGKPQRLTMQQLATEFPLPV